MARRRSAEDRRAREVQRQQQIAHARKRVTDPLRRRHTKAYALWLAAGVFGLVHLLVYVRVLPLMSSAGSIVVFGLPAVALAILGAVAYGT